jgi:dTDP-4-amino-4,6-dideoxygalactose transaminase
VQPLDEPIFINRATFPLEPYEIVAELEKRVAKYAGAPHAVAVDSCTNALLLCLKWHFWNYGASEVILPKRTYVGVAYSVINAGGWCRFIDEDWKGAYRIGNTNIVDSARRFTKDMYDPNTLYCLSAHWGKHLKIGRGGFILTDRSDIALILKAMRFDGRTANIPPATDNFIFPSAHCYMLPEEAARGLMLMNYMPEVNEDLPWDNYPDLSKFEIFTEKA